MAEQDRIIRERHRQEWLAAKHAALVRNAHLRFLYNKAVGRTAEGAAEGAGDARPLPDFEACIAAAQGRAANAEWLFRLIAARKLPAEDLPQAQFLLNLFETKKGSLAARQPALRDINAFDSVPALYAALEPYIAFENADADRAAALKAGEAAVLGKGARFTALRITSVRAAIAFETGRLWCTAYTKEPNYFYHYASLGPVIDVMDADGKAAFGVTLGSNHIADAANENVALQTLIDLDPQMGAVLQGAVRDRGCAELPGASAFAGREKDRGALPPCD